MADDGHAFALDVVPYRVRYCAVGMDAARAADTRSDDEPELDRYLLQFWPAPPGPDRIVRQTSEIAGYWHGVVREVPKPAEPARRREILEAEAAQQWAEQQELAAKRAQERLDVAVWGGPRPVGPLGDTPEAAAMARVDLALAEQLVRLAPQRQRLVARWSARALRRSGRAHEPAVHRSARHPRHRHHARWPYRQSQPAGHGPLRTHHRADPEPTQAVFVAVQHAQLAFGRDRLGVLGDLLVAKLSV